MTQQRPVSTKALNAFLVSRQMSLSIAYARIGILDHAELLKNETVSDDNVGRIARMMGMTPEKSRRARVCN